MKTKEAIRKLIIRNNETKCKDVCMYGKGLCKYEKRCNILSNHYQNAN